MAKLIEFYVPQMFQPRSRYAASGRGTVIVFPASSMTPRITYALEEVPPVERRWHTRAGLFGRLEDAVYRVLRNTDCDSTQAQASLNRRSAPVLSPSAL